MLKKRLLFASSEKQMQKHKLLLEALAILDNEAEGS
jgi:hypothetical protein